MKRKIRSIIRTARWMLERIRLNGRIMMFDNVGCTC